MPSLDQARLLRATMMMNSHLLPFIKTDRPCGCFPSSFWPSSSLSGSTTASPKQVGVYVLHDPLDRS